MGKTEQQYILFRRTDGNKGVVTRRAFYTKSGVKARAYLECQIIAESDSYQELHDLSAGKEKPASDITQEEKDALIAKMAEPGFKKTQLTKRGKEVLASMEGGSDE